MATIKTPDQRLRVFISSTINELAGERLSAKQAINKLRLIPVMFELGARPHPPRDLYRSYLQQSHIFVGIYWNSYGWVAPDMDISGLEDEYRLSENKPRLIYVKKPAPEREEKLTRLLKEIEHSGAACYRYFSNEKELGELLENDLAILLSERFGDDAVPVEEEGQLKDTLPIVRSSIVGREKELTALKDMILSTDIFMVTVTGMGGTGKTRIAIELAHRLKSDFPNGICYVSLAATDDARLVPGTIAHGLGIFDNGRQPVAETLLEFLTDKQILLLLDNFEHVAEAATLLTEITQRCRAVKLLVTSRMPLNVSIEHVFPLQPLQSPGINDCNTLEDAMRCESVNLFVQRARQVNPMLPVDRENLDAICHICRKLDGLPLAVELAALRTKFLTPVALLGRMGKVLDLLSHGHQDLPARQQALRSTIDWSYKLLDEDCKNFFYRLAVFSEGWTMETAHAVVNGDSQHGIDVMEATGKLLDLGLLRIFSHYNEETVTVEPRFTMLQTVNEFAWEKLEESGQMPAMKKSHALHFVQLCEQAEPSFWTAVPDHWFNRLQHDHANLRVTVEYLMELELVNEAWQFFGAVGHFWVARGWATEARRWMNVIGISIDRADKLMQLNAVEARYLARGLDTAGNVYFFATEFNEAVQHLRKGLEIYRMLNDRGGMARSGVLLGSALVSIDDMSANEVYREAIEHAEASNFTFGTILAHSFLAEVYTRMNRIDDAREMIERAESACEVSEKGWQLAITMLQKGNLALAVANYDEALESFTRSINAFTTCFKTIKGWAYLGLGQCYFVQQDLENARENFILAIQSGRETGEKGIVATGLLGLAGVLAAKGEYIPAARIVGSIEHYCYVLGEANWSAERLLHDQIRKMLLTGLTEEELKAASLEAYSLEAAMAMAVKGEEVVV